MSLPHRSLRRAARAAVTATAILATAVALAGCGASGETEGTDEGISIAVTDPGQLIPGRQTVAFDFARAVWSPLTFVDDEGTIEYVQAESVDSADQTTWTITLREGWTFHDGTPVTAQDYVDTWNHVAYGPNAFENSGQLAGIVGFDDLNPAEGEPATTEMSGLRVIDELTFEVTLERPDSQFPLQLSQAQTATFPMPQSAFDDLEAYNRHPIGNGPFQMSGDYTENDAITVNAYSDYAGEAATLSQIEFVPYTDMTTAYTDVRAGNLDLLFVPANRLAQAPEDFGDRFHAFDAPGISYLGLPLWDERYQDARVRQAISMAIDRDAINDVIYGGSYVPATAFTPVVEAGTPEGLCGSLCEYRPDEAKQLLTEAGGFAGEMEIIYPGGGGLDELYTAIANNLRQNLGIDAVASPTADWAEFAELRNNAELDGPFFSRWGALYPSQQATLREVFLETGSCVNCIPWYSEEVATALADADAKGSVDGTAYAEVQELILEEFPAPPLFSETYPYVTSERIAELPAASGSPILKQIELAG